ncbi:MAG: type III toxin-antitoxin system ToxN/AbiQ family toxin [Butyrivibrio sp.]|nr:type III toxin-antitoxin system ToxN/AbiQ family toxin [Butyrivibrio sp.]
MRICRIKDEYIEYLRDKDSKVLTNKGERRKGFSQDEIKQACSLKFSRPNAEI